MKTLYYISFIFLVIISCKTPHQLVKKDTKTTQINSLITPNSTIDKIIKPFKSQLDEKMNEQISTSSIELTKNGNPNLLGNLAAHLVYDYLTDYCKKNQKEKEVDFVLLNHGGLRASLPEGAIKLKHLYETFPFENKLVIVELHRKDVIKLAEFLTQSQKQHPLFGFELITENQQIKSIKIQGKLLDENKKYQIGTIDYLVELGDNMLFFKNSYHRTNTMIQLRDAIKKEMIKYKILPIITTKNIQFN